MPDKLEGKLIAALITLLVLVLGSVGLFVWGHHVGSVNQSNADDRKVTTCKAENTALKDAAKTDAATIAGLKKANQDTAAAAEANEAQLKTSVADLTKKLADSQVAFDKKHQSLRAMKNEKRTSAVGNAPLPADILNVLQH